MILLHLLTLTLIFFIFISRIAGLIVGWFLFLFIFELFLRGLLNLIALVLSYFRNDKNVSLDNGDTGNHITASTVNLKQD